MNMVPSNTKYIVKVKKFNLMGTLLKSASERNDKANITAGEMMLKYAFKVIEGVLEAIF